MKTIGSAADEAGLPTTDFRKPTDVTSKNRFTQGTDAALKNQRIACLFFVSASALPGYGDVEVRNLSIGSERASFDGSACVASSGDLTRNSIAGWHSLTEQ